MTPAGFARAVRRNADVAALLDRLPDLGLPQCHLAAGCLFQTVWNLRAGRSPAQDIRDHDVLYWDADTSWAAEDDAIRRAAALGAALGLALEVRNQARVHLWYEQRFGVPCPPLGSARAGIDRFLVAGTAVGIAVTTGGVYAPFGLDDLAAGVLRINPRHPSPALFRAKADDYRARWPWLTLVDPG
ncbi:nucleotidyltransferase family protein [Lichenibacterium minor]|uniref:Nucleotidyltransferase family protein n=1 Tax=Lichenibacterium minor TaxID=2316528 RepID=A0A4Q2U8V7_9HYPH|nr:nucleotidyltransferase family protein [Lichenibacterium minor]RYC32930.1 nucleotidyltransferase family protein [Lichenibacterium minor]